MSEKKKLKNVAAPESKGVTANVRSLLHTLLHDGEQRHPRSERPISPSISLSKPSEMKTRLATLIMLGSI